MRKPFTKISISIFTLMSFLHLLRIFFGWTVSIEDTDVGMWVSVMGCLLPGGLAIMLWRESLPRIG